MSDKIKLGLVAGLLILYFAVIYSPTARNEPARVHWNYSARVSIPPKQPDTIVWMTAWFDGENMWYAFESDTVKADSREGRRLLLEHPQRRVRLRITPVGSEQ